MPRQSRKGGKRTASRPTAKHVGTPAGKQSLNATFSDRDFRLFSLAALFLIVWIVYANALHDSFVVDDVTFSAGNRSWELGYSDVVVFAGCCSRNTGFWPLVHRLPPGQCVIALTGGPGIVQPGPLPDDISGPRAQAGGVRRIVFCSHLCGSSHQK